MAVASSDGRQFGIEKYRGIIRLSVFCVPKTCRMSSINKSLNFIQWPQQTAYDSFLFTSTLNKTHVSLHKRQMHVNWIISVHSPELFTTNKFVKYQGISVFADAHRHAESVFRTVFFRTIEITNQNAALDEWSRSDRLRYHAHTRWYPPLPLASATPHASPR